MSLKKINTVLAAVVTLFVLYLGLSFIVIPETSTPGVGLPTWPEGDGGGFLVMKGIREFSMGLVIAILLVTGHRRALGLVLLMEAVAPFGDMINVLAHHGSVAAAFGIHGLTAAVIATSGLLLLRETAGPPRPPPQGPPPGPPDACPPATTPAVAPRNPRPTSLLPGRGYVQEPARTAGGSTAPQPVTPRELCDMPARPTLIVVSGRRGRLPGPALAPRPRTAPPRGPPRSRPSPAPPRSRYERRVR
ncbi:hypothetical protein GCM10010302_08870 [Streptomyces polychromogenes]|uniref:DUF4267 domain-containing protein n=1 Tax=Streptomyces polychromogenes TaxID=67342 RepID=A0ABN0V3F7_9ACTN